MIERFNGCTGCGACKAACPKNAITMTEDSEGFLFPVINLELCIDCGKCDRICDARHSYQKDSLRECFAVSAMREDIRKVSSSGGAFAVLAETVLKKGGYVCGAAYGQEEPSVVEHILIHRREELPLLQGSKYVQSNAWVVFSDIADLLKQGETVLFSGTPCQVAGLKSYLGRTYDNLLTVEVICHGVPSQRMFRDYLQNAFGGAVRRFTFRDKKFGWGYAATVQMASGKCVSVHRKASSFYDGFIRGYLLRKSCYVCTFAAAERCADITVGDYWGVFQAHGDTLRKERKKWESGVSACIVNTEAGKNLFRMAEQELYRLPASFDRIAKENYRLLHGDPEPERRKVWMELYRKEGYRGIEEFFQKNRENPFKVKLKELLPGNVKFLWKCLKK